MFSVPGFSNSFVGRGPNHVVTWRNPHNQVMFVMLFWLPVALLVVGVADCKALLLAMIHFPFMVSKVPHVSNCLMLLHSICLIDL